MIGIYIKGTSVLEYIKSKIIFVVEFSVFNSKHHFQDCLQFIVTEYVIQTASI
jgi:hypothetical protein